MEKLLHERLREWGKKETVMGPLIVNGEEQYTLLPKAAKALAAEIERYYIPRPRFEDGEPVQFGDLFAGNNGEECGLTSVFVDLDGFYKLNSCPEYYELHLKDCNHFVKRPAPKVYDADGVETKAGDMGFDVTDGCPLESVGINGDDEYCLQVRYPNSTQTFHIMPERFTHERPVFDAEGVRICKGDTVWLVKEGYRCSVTDVLENGCIDVAMFFDGESHRGEGCAPEFFTHREPDSLEKVRDYARACSFKIQDSSYLREIDSRLTALIERGA